MVSSRVHTANRRGYTVSSRGRTVSNRGRTVSSRGRTASNHHNNMDHRLKGRMGLHQVRMARHKVLTGLILVPMDPTNNHTARRPVHMSRRSKVHTAGRFKDRQGHKVGRRHMECLRTATVPTRFT
jgi:hypothetical protein